jgi:undecaprenyl diphosphate synthase
MNKIKHVAIIMDGNGRWGLKRKNSRNFGHKQGLQTVEIILKKTIEKKIPYLTLFSFSTENWKRPRGEIRFLLNLIREYFDKHLDKIIKQGVRIRIFGQINKFPKDVKKILNKVQNKTKKNTKINVILALNYGSRDEILYAIKNMFRKKLKINKSNFENQLYTLNIPDPDILIRTGGKKRLSNFLLWQMAYTELFFVEKLWPDFNSNDLMKILNKFKSIKRNFGNI